MHPLCILFVVLSHTPAVVIVDRDNIQIHKSCTLDIKTSPIIDADGNGVIQITADDIEVKFPWQQLQGAAEKQAPDTFTGIGVRVTGKNVKLLGMHFDNHTAQISGYKVGIHAINADGLVINNFDLSNNFHQRLKSTPKAEDGSDWLWPHHNDNNEWITNYGAGLCVEDSNNVTIHNVRARKGQNGIILDRVNDSKVYDCDCSFLSGWGLAMWRSNRNTISRNAFDFCVRGYSHGVYNRGQDSAGILMFEQCCENVIAENSATHGGDGFFGFAGKEALGEVNSRDDIEWYRRRGCNKNNFNQNDFSYAAAHGLELTFSFDNVIQNNTMIGNAICGIWGGYSQRMRIHGNTFYGNGGMAYGLERGGINVEHGRENVVSGNDFDEPKCGIYLWWDEDAGTQQLPWAKANATESTANQIVMNTFDGDGIGVQLRGTDDTLFSGNQNRAAVPIDADDRSRNGSGSLPDEIGSGAPVFGTVGNGKPINARARLAGREHIIMTEWGPYDWESPLLQRIDRNSRQHTYRMLGKDIKLDERAISIEGEADAAIVNDQIIITPHQANVVTPYEIGIRLGERSLAAKDVLVPAKWQIWCFPTDFDPRTDHAAWGLDPKSTPMFQADSLELEFQHGGPSDLHIDEQLDKANVPKDHFGTIADATLKFPAGAWRIRTVSDDGIRVALNDQLVIDDWTHHAPKEHTYEFIVDEPKGIDIHVEHFELDGYAVLSLEIEAVN